MPDLRHFDQLRVEREAGWIGTDHQDLWHDDPSESVLREPAVEGPSRDGETEALRVAVAELFRLLAARERDREIVDQLARASAERDEHQRRVDAIFRGIIPDDERDSRELEARPELLVALLACDED